MYMKWLYEHTSDNAARYIVGTVGERPLICFGINPSTAEPNRLDPTVNLVRRQAEERGYDSFVMLNVYPQRATDPDDLHKAPCPVLQAENERQIAGLIDGKAYTLWAAWGALICKRPYLIPLVRRIIVLSELQNCQWVSRGKSTKDGHPHHPLYVRKEARFETFDVGMYRGL